MITRLHAITDEATRTTRKIRRENERRRHLLPHGSVAPNDPPVDLPLEEDVQSAAPFAQIEEW